MRNAVSPLRTAAAFHDFTDSSADGRHGHRFAENAWKAHAVITTHSAAVKGRRFADPCGTHWERRAQ
ncbi:MAG TPA: hypothetical protein PKE47_17755, partial [Verrucomicrobiota bacterium]|nr:hypothetical protein [Verrucomicrobiota bacterium]